MASQRGRKSVESQVLSVVGTTLKQRPEPPVSFLKNSYEAEQWREIIEAESVDWFSSGDLPLLEAYCRAAVNYRKVSKQAEGALFVIAGAHGGSVPNPIYRMQDMLAKQMATLAQKLRLTQSSRVSGHQAGSAAKKNAAIAATGSKPWERAA